MGVAASSALRVARNWNVTNRAMRQLEKNKAQAKAAPRLGKIPPLEMLPNDAELNAKNEDLQAKIDQLRITSQGVFQGVLPGDEKAYGSNGQHSTGTASKRPLPKRSEESWRPSAQSRSNFEHTGVGLPEPLIVPAGKITTSQILQLLMDYHHHKKSADELAVLYKLPLADVNDVLQSVLPFQLSDKAPKDLVPETSPTATTDATNPISQKIQHS